MDVFILFLLSHEGLLQNGQALVHLLLGDDQGRQQPQSGPRR